MWSLTDEHVPSKNSITVTNAEKSVRKTASLPQVIGGIDDKTPVSLSNCPRGGKPSGDN